MKFILLSLFFLTNFTVQVNSQDHSINAMTYNIRYDNKSDSPDWNQRKKYVIDLILFHKASILGVQEALHHQIKDMEDAMPGFSWIGKGRDDGMESGEFSPIFFKEEIFDLIETQTFWLSLTPEKPSKSWDAALPRVCTWAKFNHRPTNLIFYVFNTHFDHIGTEARYNSVKLITEKIKSIAGKAPFVLMGDFNFSPDTEPYQYLKKQENIFDAQNISQSPHYGPQGTFNGFNFHEPLGEKIDHIFVNDKFDVLRHGVISDSYELNYPSDHLPVIAEIKFKKDNLTSKDRWSEELDKITNQQFDPELSLFTGSSSIRLWTDLNKRFQNRKILNKGFGGSEIRDIIINAERLIFKHYPKHIVIYSGDNDIWSGKSATLVADDFEELFNQIRDRLPETEILFISIKPSPSRVKKIEEIKAANNLIRNFLNSQSKGTYIDVYSQMLDQEGNPDPTFFVEDNLHLNEKGYILWTKIVSPYLKN